MSISNHPAIRSVLKNNPDGLTAKQIYSITNISRDSITKALKAMPDVYVDRWLGARQGVREGGVWCVVEVPEDCPKPERKIKNVKQ
jgi:hypothetical protein